MAKKGKPKSNGQLSTGNKASLLSDEHFDSTDSVDYDEISTQSDGIDHEKVEAFRRIASAEEIEEMSDELLENDVDLASLSPERRAKVEEELKIELAKTEEEIQTLRQVLTAKVKHSHELKRKLGITVWKEFRDDMEHGIRNIQETTASGFMAKLSTPSYQKTTEAVKVASEKTTSMIGSFGGSMARKLGEVKNSNAFKSFEERVGYAVTNVKSKIGSRSNSTNNFDEALHSSENLSSTTPITSPTIPEDKPLS